MFDNKELAEKYPNLNKFTNRVKPLDRPLIGRQKEMNSLLAALMRPELCNVILLAEAGCGKTALVQGTMMKDSERIYLEVDLSKMLAEGDANDMAALIKALFDEAVEWHIQESKELVLFIDEFHQIVQMSSAAVEALKPMLADSGTRGVKVIAATTLEEFQTYVKPNQALIERLQRININQPDEDMAVGILKSFATKYKVDNLIYGDNLYRLIYQYTNRYVPASSQPRKSIAVLDAMVGWHRLTNRPLDVKLLGDVIYESQGVNIAFRVDATTIKAELDAHVFAQDYASTMIEKRLQICVADLNNHSKPMSSFLFTGSTGVGKLCADYEPVPVYTDDGSVYIKKHGDLVPGDVVFDRLGNPTTVKAVFPHTDVDMYRVHLSDGRTLDVGDEHLWSVYSSKQRSKHNKGHDVTPRVMTTKELIEEGIARTYPDSTRRHNKWFIDMNRAVKWPVRKLSIDPYVLGVLIGNGCLTLPTLTMSGVDLETVERLVELLDVKTYHKTSGNESWEFEMHHKVGNRKYLQTRDVFEDYPELMTYSSNRFIPDDYKYSSVEQRWALIQGLFDTDGTVSNDDRLHVSYSTVSKQLAYDVQYILYSLGISSTVSDYHRRRVSGGVERDLCEYCIRVKSTDEDKVKFFRLSRKLDTISCNMRADKQRVKTFDMVAISDIEYIGKQNAQCIYVDNDEHLYQAGMFVVTHNTEMTKQLASILFNDSRRLLRFDMTEYANSDSLERFRQELTSRVWERPYSIILLDEIEKACAEVTRLLLQVLDDGRLTDRNDREVSFLNSYIVVTTNAGSEIYKTIAQYGASDTGSEQMAKDYDKLIRRSISEAGGDGKFPPELLGRIDCIVPFQPLSEETMKKIARNKLNKLIKEVRSKHNVDLRISNDVVRYLVEDNLDTDSNSGGARIVMSKLESEVTTSVAAFINKHADCRSMAVLVEGTLAADDKSLLKSDAHIKVAGLKS